MLKHAEAHGVATVQSSANKISNATIYYYCAASALHVRINVREKMCWWLALARKRFGGGLPLLVTPTAVTYFNSGLY